MIVLKRIKFLSSCHFVTRCDKNSVPVASSLSDVSDYAYLTILSIIAQVSHVCRSGCQGKTFRQTSTISQRKFSLSRISTLVIDNAQARATIVLCDVHVCLRICVRKWHALCLIFRAIDVRGGSCREKIRERQGEIKEMERMRERASDSNEKQDRAESAW